MESVRGGKLMSYKMSSFELKVARILTKNNINFIREKTFCDLKKGLLRFDFFLPKEKILIECDGEQHFTQIKFFQRKRKDFTKAQERDRIKNAYCLAHQIPLFRIPYYDESKIKDLSDLFQQKYKVTSKFHNDYINPHKQ